jgi:hypothetical protein
VVAELTNGHAGRIHPIGKLANEARKHRIADEIAA